MSDPSGSLPPGLSLSTSSGLITGTPQAAGKTRFVTIEVQRPDAPDEGGFAVVQYAADDADPWTTAEFTFNISPGLAVSNQSVPAGMVGQAYSQTLTAMNVNTVNPFSGTPATGTTWSVQSGTLPAGVTLSSSGVLQGTPTTVGTYQFVVRAQSGDQSDTETLTLLVVEPLDIAQPAVGPAEVGIRFSLQLQATGGGPPGAPTYKWSLANGAVLPDGLTLNPDTGLISGTPTVAAASLTESSGSVVPGQGGRRRRHRVLGDRGHRGLHRSEGGDRDEEAEGGEGGQAVQGEDRDRERRLAEDVQAARQGPARAQVQHEDRRPLR